MSDSDEYIIITLPSNLGDEKPELPVRWDNSATPEVHCNGKLTLSVVLDFRTTADSKDFGLDLVLWHYHGNQEDSPWSHRFAEEFELSSVGIQGTAIDLHSFLRHGESPVDALSDALAHHMITTEEPRVTIILGKSDADELEAPPTFEAHLIFEWKTIRLTHEIPDEVLQDLLA